MAPSARAILRFVAVERSRQLRKTMTPAERCVWEAVRARRFRDLKFRRQHPIMHDLQGPDGFFIVDFFCHQLDLIIEVDGAYHTRTKDADAWRDFQLSLLGYHTLRFSNERILTNMKQVLGEISDFIDLLKIRHPPPL